MNELITKVGIELLGQLKFKESYWFPAGAGLIKTLAKSGRKLIITCVIAAVVGKMASHDYIIVETSMNRFFCFSKVT